MFSNLSSVRYRVTTSSKSDMPKYQSENLRSAFKIVKNTEQTRLAHTMSVTQLQSRPFQKPIAPKRSDDPRSSLGTTSNGREGTSASEPTVKTETSAFPPQYARNPSATYSGEKGDVQSPIPAVIGPRSVLEFHPSRAKATTADAKGGTHRNPYGLMNCEFSLTRRSPAERKAASSKLLIKTSDHR